MNDPSVRMMAENLILIGVPELWGTSEECQAYTSLNNEAQAARTNI